MKDYITYNKLIHNTNFISIIFIAVFFSFYANFIHSSSIERSIKERRESDIKLTNFWVTMFLLSPVTLGIYPVIQGYKQIARIDKFIQRKRKYYEGTVNYTEKYLKENNCYDEYQYKCNELRDSYKENFLKECKELNYFLS